MLAVSNLPSESESVTETAVATGPTQSDNAGVETFVRVLLATLFVPSLISSVHDVYIS